MSRRGGFTLVELMITVALIGIIAGGASLVMHRVRASAEAAIQHRRAELLLDAHAGALVRGQPLPPALDERLRVGLPDAVLELGSAGGRSTLTLRWREATGLPVQRSLVLFEVRR